VLFCPGGSRRVAEIASGRCRSTSRISQDAGYWKVIPPAGSVYDRVLVLLPSVWAYASCVAGEDIREEVDVIEEVVVADRVNRLVREDNSTRKSRGYDLHFRKLQLITDLFLF
jgi:hypothetical protein